jgi:hypothetical protein
MCETDFYRSTLYLSKPLSHKSQRYDTQPNSILPLRHLCSPIPLQCRGSRRARVNELGTALSGGLAASTFISRDGLRQGEQENRHLRRL